MKRMTRKNLYNIKEKVARETGVSSRLCSSTQSISWPMHSFSLSGMTSLRTTLPGTISTEGQVGFPTDTEPVGALTLPEGSVTAGVSSQPARRVSSITAAKIVQVIRFMNITAFFQDDM